MRDNFADKILIISATAIAFLAFTPAAFAEHSNYNSNYNTNYNGNYNYFPYNYFYPTYQPPVFTPNQYYFGNWNNYTYPTSSVANPNYNNYTKQGESSNLYETSLYGSQEVPARPNTVSGSGGVWFGQNGKDMNYWLSVWSNLPDGKAGKEKVTGAHLHCGDPGENGPVVVSLYNGDAKQTSGELARGYLSNSNIEGSARDCVHTIGYEVRSLSDLARAIREGRIYFNVHSEKYPDGAARGQLGGNYNYGNYNNPNPSSNYYHNYNYSSTSVRNQSSSSGYSSASVNTYVNTYSNSSNSWNGWYW